MVISFSRFKFSIGHSMVLKDFEIKTQDSYLKTV